MSNKPLDENEKDLAARLNEEDWAARYGSSKNTRQDPIVMAIKLFFGLALIAVALWFVALVLFVQFHPVIGG